MIHFFFAPYFVKTAILGSTFVKTGILLYILQAQTNLDFYGHPIIGLGENVILSWLVFLIDHTHIPTVEYTPVFAIFAYLGHKSCIEHTFMLT